MYSDIGIIIDTTAAQIINKAIITILDEKDLKNPDFFSLSLLK